MLMSVHKGLKSAPPSGLLIMRNLPLSCLNFALDL